MVNNSVEKKYLKKIKLIEKYNKFYFDNNKPLVTDQEYDQLKIDILKLEKDMSKKKKDIAPLKKKYPFLASSKSIQKKIEFAKKR